MYGQNTHPYGSLGQIKHFGCYTKDQQVKQIIFWKDK